MTNVKEILFHSRDSQTLYIITNQGLYVSYNAAEDWDKIYNSGSINSLAPDPSDKNIIYLSIGNRIYRTANAGVNWENIYVEATGTAINSLAVDNYDNRKIYAGRSDGILLRSEDQGGSWNTINDFKNSITKILINKNDTRIIYIVTQTAGIFRTDDTGLNWSNIISKEDNKNFPGINNISQIMFNYNSQDSLLMTCKYGLLETSNGGGSWQAFDLLSAPGKTTFYSLAVNSQNDNEIYYGIKNTLYKTTDRGKNWITYNLPTSRTPTYLITDSDDGNIIYMGVTKIEEKKRGLLGPGW